MPFLQNNKTKVLIGLGALIVIVAIAVGGNLGGLKGAVKIQTQQGDSEAVEARKPGKITVSASSNPVADDKRVATDSNILVARYTITAETEPFLVTKLTFQNDSDGTNPNAKEAGVKEVKLRYPSAFLAPTTLDMTAIAVFVDDKVTFTDLKLRVSPKAPVDVELIVNMKPVGEGGTGSGDQVELDYKAQGPFEAIGSLSGYTVTEASSSANYGTTVDVDAGAIAFYKTLPTFQKDNSENTPCSSTLVEGSQSPIYCFKVSAAPSGDVSLSKLKFEATPTQLNTSSSNGLAKGMGFKLYHYDPSTGTSNTQVIGSGTWANGLATVIPYTWVPIPAGSTHYYVLAAPIDFTESNELSSLSVRLLDEAVTNHHERVNISWSDLSTSSGGGGGNGYKLEYLPTDVLQLQENPEATSSPQVTVAFNGPSAQNIPVGSNDENIFEFSIASSTAVQVNTLWFTLKAPTSDSTSDSQDLINQLSTPNFSDIKVVDVDSGEVVGPSQELTIPTSANYLDTYQHLYYTQPFSIGAGEVRNLRLSLDVASNSDLPNEVIYLTLNPLTATGEATITDQATGLPVTAIIPSIAIMGNNMTVSP